MFFEALDLDGIQYLFLFVGVIFAAWALAVIAGLYLAVQFWRCRGLSTAHWGWALWVGPSLSALMVLSLPSDVGSMPS